MDNINWNQAINYKQIRNQPPKPKEPPKIDPYVSEIVGRDIMINDPKLIKWAADKSKQNKSDTIPTNMLEDKINRRELTELFHGKHRV